LNTPTGISFDREKNLLVVNRNNNEILKVNKSGTIYARKDKIDIPVGVVEDKNGDLIVINYGGNVKKVFTDGRIIDFSQEFKRPGVGISEGSKGEILAIDNGGNCVRQIFFDGITKVIDGCIGLTIFENTLYVTSWDKGEVYLYLIEYK